MTIEENIRAILECNFAGFKEEIIDTAVKKIAEIESRWIPVSERLPKEYDLVLVTEKYGFVDTARFVHNDFTEMDEWIVADDETIDVIAWMQLPGPYKKVGENK